MFKFRPFPGTLQAVKKQKQKTPKQKALNNFWSQTFHVRESSGNGLRKQAGNDKHK